MQQHLVIYFFSFFFFIKQRTPFHVTHSKESLALPCLLLTEDSKCFDNISSCVLDLGSKDAEIEPCLSVGLAVYRFHSYIPKMPSAWTS